MAHEAEALLNAHARDGRSLSSSDIAAVVAALRGSTCIPGGALEAYVAELTIRVVPSHAKQTESAIRRVLAAAPTLEMAPVAAFRQQRLADGASRRTAHYDVAAASAFADWCADHELISRNPLERLRRLPSDETHLRKRRRALSDVEVKRFLKAAAEFDAECLKERGIWKSQAPFWRALIETGMRWWETVSLRGRDLQKDVVTLQAGRTKSRRSRKIPVSPTLLELIGKVGKDDLLFPRPDGKPWRRNNRTWCRLMFWKILRRAKIARKSKDGRSVDIHALRGTAATRMVRHGASIAAVSRVLGHADIRTTMRFYVDFDIQDVRKAVKSCW